MTIWTAQTVCTAPDLSPDDVADLAVDLGAGITYDGETGRLKAIFEIEAATLRRAANAALRLAAETLPAKPAEIVIQTTEQYVADTEHPAAVDLVSLGEAAELLGISRARIDQLCKAPRSGFPAPLARVGSGPVWTRASLEAYKERARPLPPGRPRKDAGELADATSWS